MYATIFTLTRFESVSVLPSYHPPSHQISMSLARKKAKKSKKGTEVGDTSFMVCPDLSVVLYSSKTSFVVTCSGSFGGVHDNPITTKMTLQTADNCVNPKKSKNERRRTEAVTEGRYQYAWIRSHFEGMTCLLVVSFCTAKKKNKREK